MFENTDLDLPYIWGTPGAAALWLTLKQRHEFAPKSKGLGNLLFAVRALFSIQTSYVRQITRAILFLYIDELDFDERERDDGRARWEGDKQSRAVPVRRGGRARVGQSKNIKGTFSHTIIYYYLFNLSS